MGKKLLLAALLVVFSLPAMAVNGGDERFESASRDALWYSVEQDEENRLPASYNDMTEEKAQENFQKKHQQRKVEYWNHETKRSHAP
ncbi:MAG: hypothetical protein HOE90_19945 [Bacteriovoracaceae bacterium]|jgi:hypothetical protein|nr:hypothetical protein [Bacteriovoracaceae bacterium]